MKPRQVRQCASLSLDLTSSDTGCTQRQRPTCDWKRIFQKQPVCACMRVFICVRTQVKLVHCMCVCLSGQIEAVLHNLCGHCRQPCRETRYDYKLSSANFGDYFSAARLALALGQRLYGNTGLPGDEVDDLTKAAVMRIANDSLTWVRCVHHVTHSRCSQC